MGTGGCSAPAPDYAGVGGDSRWATADIREKAIATFVRLTLAAVVRRFMLFK